MPTLRFPVVGSRVITQGSVMKRPPSFGQHLRMGKSSNEKLSRVITKGSVMTRPQSFGQHLRMGKSSNEKLSRVITSLHGPVATVLGKNLPISASIGSIDRFGV